MKINKYIYIHIFIEISAKGIFTYMNGWWKQKQVPKILSQMGVQNGDISPGIPIRKKSPEKK